MKVASNRILTDPYSAGMAIHSILLVDDDPSVLETVQLMLERSGYAVSAASGGREALRKLKHETVDLVITDLLMPDMDGIELINVLHKGYAGLPVVAMSGGRQLSADTYLMIARGFHVDFLLRKPFTCGQLLEAIAAAEARSANSVPSRAVS
jgi:CheY-like chemotaxis protein